MLERINVFLWSVPVLGLILGTGVWLTGITGFAQVRLFPAAWRDFLRRLRSRDSGFRALCTALAATVGTGNIAGVAGAIAIGGPGAVLWMWVSAFLGMAVKCAESVLAVRYREPDGRAGPMYIIRKGLPRRWHWLAWVYCFFGIVAAFGVGNATQVNAVLSSLELAGGGNLRIVLGLVLAVVVAVMVMGGAKSICSVAEVLVPVVSGGYILLCAAALVLRWDRLGEAMGQILLGAFDPGAVTGGVVGGMMTTLRLGVSRGTFTNEAGMGTAAIAHGTAETVRPVDQGLMGIMEVFLDTMVICTLTALVILTGGIPIPYGTAAGAELTAAALAARFGVWVHGALCACLVLFALATILGWGFYAGRCAEYLFGSVNWKVFGLCQGAGVLLGVFLETGTVWTLAEIVNGLMALPNLAAVLALSAEVRSLLFVDRSCRSMVSSLRGDTNEKEKHSGPPAGRDPAVGLSGGPCAGNHGAAPERLHRRR